METECRLGSASWVVSNSCCDSKYHKWFALGVATIFVMMLSNISISPIRNYVPESARVPIFILVIAGLVTIVDLSINALSKPCMML